MTRNTNMFRKIIVIISTLIVILTVVSCSSNRSFERIMDICVEKTGRELKRDNGFHTDDEFAYYDDIERGKAKRTLSINPYLILIEFDQKSEGYYRIWPEISKDARVGESNVIITKVTDESKIMGYKITLEQRDFKNDLYFDAQYLLGRNYLSFSYIVNDEYGLEEYETYREICEELNLHVSEEADELIRNIINND